MTIQGGEYDSADKGRVKTETFRIFECRKCGMWWIDTKAVNNQHVGELNP